MLKTLMCITMILVLITVGHAPEYRAADSNFLSDTLQMITLFYEDSIFSPYSIDYLYDKSLRRYYNGGK